MVSFNDLMQAARGFVRSALAKGLQQTDEYSAVGTLEVLNKWANLTHGLTPARLRTILQSADEGEILEQHKLFADMEDRCDHLAAELSKRKRALLTLDWDIQPGRAGDAKAERVAEAVKEQFEALGNVEDLMLDMADAIGHGFAALEIEWGREGSLHLPQAFHFRPQTWFQTHPNNLNSLRLRDGTSEGAELLPFGWVLHVHRSRSGWLPRAGLFRVLAWSFLLREYALSAHAAYVDVHGLPFRLGKYPPGSSKEDKAALRRALQYLGRDASGIIPQGMEILFETPANSSHDHFGALADRCERGMSKAILGGTLTSQADGKTSTNALGNVHNEIRHDLLISDALQLAGTLTRQVLAPLAILNSGVNDPRLLPWFRFDTREAEDLTQYADALPKLAAVMRIPASWAHEKLKIPVAGKDDDILMPVAPAASTAVPAALAALSAVAAPAGGDAYPDQTAVDAVPVPDKELHKAMEAMLAPLMDEMRQGADPADLLGRLGELYPQMDSGQLEDLLARALFVAEVWGSLSASDEQRPDS